MKAPIIVDRSGDVQAFESLEEAQTYLEPPDVDCPKTRIFDAEGRLLKARISHWRGMKKLFGFISIPASGEGVVLELSDQSEPVHEHELRNLLVEFLSHPSVQRVLKPEGKGREQCSVSELIALLLQTQSA